MPTAPVKRRIPLAAEVALITGIVLLGLFLLLTPYYLFEIRNATDTEVVVSTGAAESDRGLMIRVPGDRTYSIQPGSTLTTMFGQARMCIRKSRCAQAPYPLRLVTRSLNVRRVYNLQIEESRSPDDLVIYRVPPMEIRPDGELYMVGTGKSVQPEQVTDQSKL